MPAPIAPQSLAPPSFVATAGDRSIPVLFGADPAATLCSVLSPESRVALVADCTVGPLCLPQIRHALSAAGVQSAELTFPAGERHKRWHTVEALASRALRSGIDRDSTFVAVGGGVCLDLAGFLASIYMRGTPWVNVPTSLLAMVDVALGGKTGIDTDDGKNLLGTFHQPAAVVVAVSFLRTLPPAQRLAGMSELVKTALVGDARLFESLRASAKAGIGGDEAEWESWVAAGLRGKASVVQRDERDAGVRAVLNLGHTLAHGIERATGWLVGHGEAVAVGIRWESWIARELGLLEADELQCIERLLEAIGLARAVRADPGAVRCAMGADKKRRAGELLFALPTGIGTLVHSAGPWTVRVPDELVTRAVESACSG